MGRPATTIHGELIPTGTLSRQRFRPSPVPRRRIGDGPPLEDEEAGEDDEEPDDGQRGNLLVEDDDADDGSDHRDQVCDQ